MKVQTIKQTIHQLIDKIEDEDLLQAFLKIIESGTSKSLISNYSIAGEHLTKEMVVKRSREASKRVKSGDVMTLSIFN